MSMTLTDLVAPNAIVPALKVNNKKQAIQELAAPRGRAHGSERDARFWKFCCNARSSVPPRWAMAWRSRTASWPSSAVCSGCSRGWSAGIDFEALDGQPVDLIFLLLAPEAAGADHLKALARVARLLRDPEVARKLRDSRDADALYAVLAMPAASSAA